MRWPHGKEFAFTIIDDTDNASVANVKPVYDFLNELDFRTTKTIWVYPPRDKYQGQSLQDENYKAFVMDLANRGFEIASHGVGSGKFLRNEIIAGFNNFKSIFRKFPQVHINHSQNECNVYWGVKRFVWPVSWVMKLSHRTKFQGEQPDSDSFWGDFVKNNIPYMRNLVFNDINTLRCDPAMPYREKKKDQYSNFWFSSSDGHTVQEFLSLIQKSNVDRLSLEGGCCIVYTHFASGFVEKNGELNSEFKKRMTYLSQLNGWFVPAEEILNYLKDNNEHGKFISRGYLLRLNIRWLFSRVKKRIIFKR